MEGPGRSRPFVYLRTMNTRQATIPKTTSTVISMVVVYPEGGLG